MDHLYSSPPYSYLPQEYNNNNNHRYDRPSYTDHHHHSNELDSYHHWSNQHHSPYTSNTATVPRPKITTNLWEDEGTLCFQVDAKGICVARRQDNDMINGTKLLNVVGMSRGKRDGILKNEKGRVVVKVGAMHLKGVWIPFARATELAEKFKILDVLYPLFVDEPSIYLSSNQQQHHHHEVILPTVNNNKCNLQRTLMEDSSLSCLPDWDNNTNRPPPPSYSFINHHQHHNHHSSSSAYDTPQVLHRSHPDLNHSPIPTRSNYQQDDLYLHDYPTRPFSQPQPQNNRHSFSSVSSNHSYLYHHQQEQEHEENKSSYLDSRPYSITSLPYIKTSPYTSTTTMPTLSNVITTTNTALDENDNNRHSSTSAGSTTPSSWFSPETPTAVLFHHNHHKEENQSKKRKASTCLESSQLKKTMTSPSLCATLLKQQDE